VVLVPNAAVKTQGDQKYVQILDASTPATSTSGTTSNAVIGTPRQQVVETGLSNDTDTEITSGLNGNENVVIQTVTTGGSKASTTAAQSSSLRIPGLTGGAAAGGARSGGGGFRTGG
jgi:hypothetical protein